MLYEPYYEEESEEKKQSDAEMIKDGLALRKPLRETWESIPGEVRATTTIKEMGE